MTFTPHSAIPESILSDLRIEDDDGDYYAAVGTAVTFMYAQRMESMIPTFRRMVDLFSEYIAPLELDSKCIDQWTDYTPKQLNRLLNRFASYSRNGQELVLARLDEEGTRFQYFGEFGMRLIGWSDSDTSFRHTDACTAHFELPIHEVQRVGRDKLISLVRSIASLAPFQHGMCGYSFKYFHREGSSRIYTWMGDKALRYLAIHPMMNAFEYYCRHQLPNVNWITLLGDEMTTRLGGASAIRNALTSAVDVETLQHGTMLVAGEAPPLGDRNQGAPDLGPLREVAKLARPILLDRNIYRYEILNYLFEGDDEEERIERWLNRFDWQPGQP